MGIKIIRCENPKCGKMLKLKPGQKRLSSKRRYCNRTCQTRHQSTKKYYKLRNDPEYLKKKSDIIKSWYKKNKKHQAENVLRQYYLHKDRWNERGFVYKHKEELFKLINPKCTCGEPVKIIHHITYLFKRNWKNRGPVRIDPFNLKEYAQFLIGFCSKKCHGEHHRKLNDSKEFLSLESVYDILKRKVPLINQLTKEGE